MNSALLELSIALPLVCAVILFAAQRVLPDKVSNLIAFPGFVFPCIAAVVLWINFGAQGSADLVDGFAFVTRNTDGTMGHDLGLGGLLGIRLTLGLNGISMPMFAMAGIVGLAAGFSALLQTNVSRRNLFLALLLLMHSGLMGVFSSIDLFFFYFFHEFALIPTFILIGIWGTPGKRTVALEVTIYLTLGAMLSLVGLVALYGNFGSTESGFNLIEMRRYFAAAPIEQLLQQNLTALLCIGFGILVSLFPFHSWAPRAYSTAPTANAMLHAGVLKKFGLYGLIQIAATLMPDGLAQWSTLLVILALCNIVFIGLVTVAQQDLKQMVSCSSVMHMGYAFLGIAALSTAGTGSAVILMFGHGLTVALLFLLGQFIKDRSETMDMLSMGGLGPKAPLLAGAFVLATFASIGLPGFANFWGEFGVFIALGQNSLWAVPIAALGIVIAAVYGLRSVARIFFGEPTEAFRSRLQSGAVNDLSVVERIPVLALLIPLIVVGFWPKSVSDGINRDAASFADTPAIASSATIPPSQ